VIVNHPKARHILVVIGSYHFLQQLTGIFNAGFIAHDEMMYPAILGILERMIILLAGSMGIYYSLAPALTLTVYPMSAGIFLAASFAIFRIRHGRPDFRFHYQFIKTAVRQASPFLVIIILAQFYDRIGLIILIFMKDEAVAGIFMAGDRLLATINGFSAIFAIALFPSVSRLSMEKKEDLERLCAWSLRMVFIFLFPLASLIYIFSDQFIFLVFGDKFIASAGILRIACWTLVLFGFNRILSIVLIAFYKQDQLVRIRIIAYVCYFFLSVLLVGKFSYLGLAWSKIIAETGLFLLSVSCAVKVSPSVSTLKRFLVPAALCLLAVVGFGFTDSGHVSTLVFFLALFVSTTVVFKVVCADDFKVLKIWLVKKAK
jgi:O-antigen/teichoic acid export membrane protein